MQGAQNPDPAFLAKLAEAQQNMALAESDESGGFHNNLYYQALLNDAISQARSLPILDAAIAGRSIVLSWTGAGTLQSAGSPNGPWQDVANPTNPLILQPPLPAQAQFYRLRP